MPTHSPAAKAVWPTKRMKPNRPSLSSILCPANNSVMIGGRLSVGYHFLSSVFFLLFSFDFNFDFVLLSSVSIWGLWVIGYGKLGDSSFVYSYGMPKVDVYLGIARQGTRRAAGAPSWMDDPCFTGRECGVSIGTVRTVRAPRCTTYVKDSSEREIEFVIPVVEIS